MKRKLQQFLAELRRSGVRISLAESLDALRAAAVVGVDALSLREGLAASVVKDEADRPRFDAVFDAFFALPDKPRPIKKRRARGSSDAGRGGFGTNGDSGRSGASAPVRETRPASVARSADHRAVIPGQRERDADSVQRAAGAHRLEHLAHHLRRKPFDEFTDADREEWPALAATLARRYQHFARRRTERSSHGRLDMRRTMRRAATSGGVPVEIELRRRRVNRPDLVALCDASHSVAFASEFLLAMLAPAGRYFRRVSLFGFVDSVVPVALADGRLVPDGPLDPYARSDFGRALVQFSREFGAQVGRGTVLLILGDARNNRLPPHVAALRALRDRAKRVVWLNPEERRRWDTGDSVMRIYARECDVVLGARTPSELEHALKALWRPIHGTPRRSAGAYM